MSRSGESWRPIPGTDGQYEASSLGRIRSWKAYHGTPGPRILAQMTKSRLGHQMVFLFLDGKRKSTLVHRAVLAAFGGSLRSDMQCRHLDGNPLNNRLENLAWGTQSDNELDKVRHGTHRNANKTHCIRGHEFTPENTFQSNRGRGCRTCRLNNQRKRNARKVGAS